MMTDLQIAAVADGVTDDTDAINDAIAYLSAHGGGTAVLPPGTILVSNSNLGATSWDNRRAVYINDDNIHLRGAGIGATILKLANGANAHVVKFGQRDGGTLTVQNCSLSGLTIDGNRANQVTPDEDSDHNSGVDVASGCGGIVLRDLYIHDTMYYGIGFQRDNFSHCLVEHVEIADTGADGLDWKGDSDANTGNVLRHVRVRRWGKLSTFSAQAGIDLRSGIMAHDLDVAEPGPATVQAGIRLQNGVPGAVPVQATQLSHFRVDGGDAPGSYGVRVITRYGVLAFGEARGFSIGYYLTDPYIRGISLLAEDNDLGFRLDANATAGTKAGTAALVGITARENVDGVLCSGSVNEVTFLGADIRSNTGKGFEVASGCQNVRLIGGSLTGNGTNLTDNGAGTVIRSVSGARTEGSASASVNVDSTGVKSFTIAHGLTVAPSAAEVSLTMRRKTTVSDWAAAAPVVTGTDGTNIYGEARVTTASTMSGAQCYITAITRTKTG